jgi:hypothetical protein
MMKRIGWAFTCENVATGAGQLFSWLQKDDADRNHAVVRNDVMTWRNVSEIFPVYRETGRRTR